MFVYIQSSAAAGKQVVGVWFVTFPDPPFKYHMVTFHQDGTMEQANPDAGDANTSDSDGMGVWEMRAVKSLVNSWRSPLIGPHANSSPAARSHSRSMWMAAVLPATLSAGFTT